ncbi:LysM peptidoglycan-binding domain-containing protein [Bacillus sp. FJAT-28004]|uniref:LysM peptidoglycan-binding domain-containing protein n=1 Tax=Bacillus sp. FJAT-28004 TaxID=1679165 RepID=UPI000A5A4AB6|nr:LysM peptidoglycan-binding domain-containing protein [Bacillus sp. FJAT-28004]
MFYSIPWISEPRHQPSFYTRNAIHPGTYPYNSYTWQTNYIPYRQTPAPFFRMERGIVQGNTCISKAVVELNQTFRTLWEQHVAWTRMLIISIAEELPDLALVTERLLRNPTDMAAVFRHYYGDAVASQFDSLMREHLVLAAQLVKAAKAGNNQAAAEAEKKWYANADEIAGFLNSINPNWPKSVLQNMLYEHLRMTKDEAVFRLSKKYKSDIEAFDQIEKQALEMADAFTAGIVAQFPNAFQ